MLSDANHPVGEREKRPSVGLRSFAEPVLERSEGLRMTATVWCARLIRIGSQASPSLNWRSDVLALNLCIGPALRDFPA
jgi:hypothetical protein